MPIERAMSSASSLNEALHWHQDCVGHHLECNQRSTSDKYWLPARLVDLGQHDALTWKLCIAPKTDERMTVKPYLALSYRWGENPQLKLTSSTLEQFRSGRLIQELPRTFRDLVMVARLLSVRYVWIDALCIMQDSKEDWETEALTMCKVYSTPYA